MVQGYRYRLRSKAQEVRCGQLMLCQHSRELRNCRAYSTSQTAYITDSCT